MRQSWETITSVSTGHIILTPDPTRKGRAATAGIEPGISSLGVARFTNWATEMTKINAKKAQRLAEYSYINSHSGKEP